MIVIGALIWVAAVLGIVWGALVRLKRLPGPLRAVPAAIACTGSALLVAQLVWDAGDLDCTLL